MTLSEMPSQSATPDPATETAAGLRVVDLLSDEHARAIIRSVRDEAKPAREIVADCDSSRTTVYRRLDALQRAGVIRTTMQYDSDGHHCNAYALRVDSVTLSFGPDGLDCVVHPAESQDC